MAKKKKTKAKKGDKYKRFSKVDNVGQESKEEVRLKGRCLKCRKPMFKNHKTCKSCSRKKRLKSKANRRGKPQKYYLDGGSD